MSIQIVSSRIKRPSDRQCIGIGWLTSSKFQLGCLLSRLIGCLSCLKEQNELVSCWFSLNSDFTMTIFLFLQEKNTTQKFTIFKTKISWIYTISSYLFQLVVVGLGFVGGPFELPPSIVGCTTSFLILVETSNFFSTYHTKSECWTVWPEPSLEVK